MAEIKARSAGRAGWVYDVGGKTYFTEAEAQRAAARIDQQEAQQQQQQTTQTTTTQRTTQGTTQGTAVGATDIVNGATFTSNLDGRDYKLVKGIETATVYDRNLGKLRIAEAGEKDALRREGEEYLIDTTTGEIVKNFRSAEFSSVKSNLGSQAAEFINNTLGVDMEREADGSYTDLAKQRRGITQDFSPEDIGSYQRATLEAQDQIISRINGTGSYVIADVVRNGTVLAQNIYDPSGKFLKAVNPRLSGREAQLQLTDATQALAEIQAITFGTKEQRVQALENQLKRDLTRLSTYDMEKVGSVNQSRLNSVIRSKAQFVIAAKTGSSYNFIRGISDPVAAMTQGKTASGAGVALDIRNWAAIASSSNPIAALASANAAALQFIQPSSGSAWGSGEYAQYNAPGGVSTSNGFTIGYRSDATRGAVKGRLVLVSPTGATLSIGTADRFGLSMAGLQAGFGSFDADEFATFISDKQFRDGDLNQQFINRLTNAATSYATNTSYYTIDINQGPTVDPGWLPNGNLYNTWQTKISEYAAQQEAERAAERAARQSTGTSQLPIPGVTTTTTQTQYPNTGTGTAQETPVTPATPGTPTGVTTPTGIQTPTGVTGGTTYPQVPTTGTFPTPTETGGTGAIPGTITTATGVAGFNQQQLSQTMPGSGGTQVGVRTVTYSNQYGQSIPVTEQNGSPITYVPPGYSRTGAAAGGLMRTGYAQGGMSEDKMLEAKYRIASMNGYNGPKTNQALDAFASASPAMKAKFNAIGAALAKGGYLRKNYSGGGLEDGSTFSLAPGTTVGQTTTDPNSGTSYRWNGSAWEVQSSATSTTTEQDPFQQSMSSLVTQTMQPIQAPVSYIQPTELDFIPSTAGQVTAQAPMAQAVTAQNVEQAMMPVMTPASFMQASTAAPQVQQATEQMQPAQGQVSQQAQVQAAQQGTTSVSGMQAAQGTAILMDNPVQRQIQSGELITGAADAQTAAAFTEQVQAATATPSKQATVQGQLESLMQQFEGGNRPAWAAASMRNATAVLAARGLGASSLAGQAVIQAAMEAALPIAQMDAQIQSQFEAQNLSNRQQRAMLAAQQRAEFLGMEFTQEFQARVQNSARIGDIANMNFTAEQNIALENSRAANTVNLNNLSNRQAMVMAEAAALSQLDMQNLNNRQQAAVQNAQNFLQMDMTNLSNQQQAAMFKAQSTVQALFTDQAAKNAAAQFNASSENQTNQFFASLSSQTSQFNASQQNAMEQFNVNSVNALREFNANLQQQRDMFNAQNGLVIAQANAQWRQNIATLNTASQNQSNMDFAKTINALTSTNLDQIWQRERDLMSFAFTSSENSMDRALKIILGDKQLESVRMQLDAQEKAAKGSLFTRFLFGSGGAGGGGLLGKLVPGLGLG